MKRILLVLVLAAPLHVFTQILPAGTSLEEARQTAASYNKMIALLVESATCADCNMAAEKALEAPALQQYLADSFVVLRIGVDHADRDEVKRSYNYQEGNIVLFLDEQGTLIHRMSRSTTRYQDYIAEGKTALLKKPEGEKMRALEKTGLEGKLSNDELYALISARRALRMPTDRLLALYVSRLSKDSLRSATVLQGIARACPILGSGADKALRHNQELFTAAWYALPLSERQEINRQVIAKTLTLAVGQRNDQLAEQVADFSKAIHDDREAGEQAYTYNRMEYYRRTANTKKFVVLAATYYDQYYMTRNPSEVKEKDSLKRLALLKTIPGDTIKTGQRFTVRKTVSVSGEAQEICNVLTNGVRTVYEMTNDTRYLRKALDWVAHANSFFDNPDTMDLWARLLYKVEGNTTRAIELEEKAIALREERGLDARKYQETLKKLKAGKL
ncbi:hypothetical protein HB364_19695 [Pseudoflavitalea sp. X16]|uniref:hypothetical protein n=1 Tax=Paraflavitalea devenefica TaxID=2716334 RepID=UPI00141F641B|nr:hypothetical protein [Paraflavitalea devenefica]NII27323.1 hypothetical protein [Paraflavitalea devenefica]